MARRPLLLQVTAGSNLPLFVSLADRLANAGESIALCFDGPDERVHESLARAAARLRAPLYHLPQLVEQALRRRRNPPGRLQARLSLLWYGPPTRDVVFARDLDLRRRAARRVVRKARPKALVVPEDGISAEPWLIQAAHERGVPVLDVPYGLGAERDLENDLARKQAAGELIRAEGEMGQRVARDHPQWVKTGRFAGALMYPPEVILARERLGASVARPWTIHGGPADRLAVESRAMHAHYLREGIPPAKLAPTGTLYCDVMSERMAAHPEEQVAFEKLAKIRPDETSILVCWPPSYHDGYRDACEFDSYERLTRETLDFLVSLPKTRVTVSLHPAVPDADRERIAALGARVVEEWIIEQIAAHDVFVTCYSSTARWAIACRKPVVNYDMYGFRLPDYEAAEGFVDTRSQAAFRDAVTRLVADDAHYHEVAGLQRSVSDDWGALDGRNFERIHGLLTDLVRGEGRSL